MNKPYEFRGHAYRSLAEAETWTQQYHEPALEPELAIIDPHHHVWDDQRGRYLTHELAADVDSGHNIIATVFVEAGVMYRADGPAALKPVGEVEFVNGVAAMGASGNYGKARLCAGIVGHADLMLGDKVTPVLEALTAAGNGRFKGIRYGTIWDVGNAAKFGRHQVPRHLMGDATFRQGFACLQPLKLSFEAWLFHPQLDDLAALLRVFPEANVVLNHCGGLLGIAPYEGKRDEVHKVWLAHIRNLAQFPNLSVKIGGLGMLYSNWDFHLRDTPPSSSDLASAWRPYVEGCIEAFGAGRCMMESNFPPDKQTCGYGVLWNAMKRITGKCSAAEKAALYRDTAARVYRLDV
ncbi:MAG: amidohydrolase [Betaproteobacteria bacterium]|nr:amidohydrolase [Betaproteobacteria bacterium]